MASLEGNKIAAAILVGGMITLSVGIITDFIYQPRHGAEAAHAGGEGAAPAAKQPAPLEPVLGLIATADVAKGETIAKKCQTCHTFDASGTNKVGPGLYGVDGTPTDCVNLGLDIVLKRTPQRERMADRGRLLGRRDHRHLAVRLQRFGKGVQAWRGDPIVIGYEDDGHRNLRS